MALLPDYKLEIKSANPASFTLGAVVNAPRTCTAMDVSAACNNVELAFGDDQPPLIVSSVVRYLTTEFFSFSHRTGLYNRQRMLWEALGRSSAAEAYRLKQGLFKKVEMPFLDIYLSNGKGKVLILAHLVESEALSSRWLGDDQRLKEHLQKLLQRAERLKLGQGALSGIFLIYPAPFPKIVLSKVSDLTAGLDPVGRYESLLAEPLAVPIDLIEYEQPNVEEEPLTISLRLIHPHLAPRDNKSSDKGRV